MVTFLEILRNILLWIYSNQFIVIPVVAVLILIIFYHENIKEAIKSYITYIKTPK